MKLCLAATGSAAGLEYRAKKERVELTQNEEESDARLASPFPIPNELIGAKPADRKAGRLAVRLFSQGDYTSDRWVGVPAHSFMNAGLGLGITSGSAFALAEKWDYDPIFQSEPLLELLRVSNQPTFITLEFYGPALLRGWVGVPYFGVYAILESFGRASLSDIFQGNRFATMNFSEANLVTRYPYPHRTAADQISFLLPSGFYPFCPVVNGFATTERTCLGVLASTSRFSTASLAKHSYSVIRDLRVPELQMRTDLNRILRVGLALPVRNKEIQLLVDLEGADRVDDMPPRPR